MRHNIFLILVLAMVIGCKKDSAPTTNSKDPIQKIKEDIAKAPNYENYVALGMEYAKQNNGAEALAAYQKAIAINPKAPVAWNNVCAEYNRQLKYGDAVPNCEKALELEPTFSLARNNLNHSKAELGKTLKGLETKKTEILSGKPSGEQLVNLGMEFYTAKDFKTSIDIWKRVKSSDPLYPTALSNLATSYILLKDFGLAEKAIDEALKREPNNSLFVNNKKWLEQEKSLKK